MYDLVFEVYFWNEVSNLDNLFGMNMNCTIQHSISRKTITKIYLVGSFSDIFQSAFSYCQCFVQSRLFFESKNHILRLHISSNLPGLLLRDVFCALQNYYYFYMIQDIAF